MSGLGLAAVSALWLGILTSVSPCPLATNITAISFVGRRAGSPRGVLLAGVLYTLGRALVYTGIGALLIMSLLSAPTVSLLLQSWMNRLLGPILILVGMVMLGLLRFSTSGRGVSERMQTRVERWGLLGRARPGSAVRAVLLSCFGVPLLRKPVASRGEARVGRVPAVRLRSRNGDSRRGIRDRSRFRSPSLGTGVRADHTGRAMDASGHRRRVSRCGYLHVARICLSRILGNVRRSRRLE